MVCHQHPVLIFFATLCTSSGQTSILLSCSLDTFPFVLARDCFAASTDFR